MLYQRKLVKAIKAISTKRLTKDLIYKLKILNEQNIFLLNISKVFSIYTSQETH